MTRNTLFAGDNLPMMRQYLPTASVDLVYLDPPFNSSRSYNVLFKDEQGKDSESQIVAFEDTWSWGPTAEATYTELVTQGSSAVSTMISALRSFIGASPMLAYLVMMAARLVELHRVLKPTGSLYLHCDPTASHYLKVVLDTIFGAANFRNELVWKRQHAHSSAKRWGPIHDTILFYTKSSTYTWRDVRQPYEHVYAERYFKFDDGDGRGRYWTGDLTGAGIRHGETGQPWRGFDPTAKGRHWAYPPALLDQMDANSRIYWPKTPGAWPKLKRYLHEAKGVPLQDIILDVASLVTMGGDREERLGYPTQKPLALLERIIAASSNAGDIVLDPFCGGGTAIAAAQKLDRRWVGIDQNYLSIALQKYRLRAMFDLAPGTDYDVVGEPTDAGAARQLANDDRTQFQWWALSLVGARPCGGEAGSRTGKKGRDTGIDGVITFLDDPTRQAKRILIQVTADPVKRGDIRDLRGTVEREAAAMGVFITLEPPTKPMLAEATSAGAYPSPGWQRDYPRIQIMTVADLLNGQRIEAPPRTGVIGDG